VSISSQITKFAIQIDPVTGELGQNLQDPSRFEFSKLNEGGWIQFQQVEYQAYNIESSKLPDQNKSRGRSNTPKLTQLRIRTQLTE
jgi:phage-related protein